MLQDDYLMRMIRLATSVFAHILGLKQIGSYQDALAVIDQALEVIFGVNPALLNTLDDDSLIALLTSRDGLDVDKLLILAGLFKERGDIYAAIEQPGESRSYYYRAASFYLDLFFNPVHIPTDLLSEKIEELLLAMAAQPLTDELNYPLFFYFEQTKQYGQANRALTSLLATNGVDPELRTQARTFYKHLLELSDDELALGKIGREEVLTQIERFK